MTTTTKLQQTDAAQQPQIATNLETAPRARWSVDAIRAAQRVGAVKRARPGVVPLDTAARAKRRGRPPGAFALLDWLTDQAHGGPISGADCSGLVSVPSLPWIAEQTGRSARTVRRQLATIERAGLALWLARPSRSRPGVLAITDCEQVAGGAR